MDFTVKHGNCDKVKNWDNEGISIAMTCDSDIASDAIAISHRRNGSEVERGVCIYCDFVICKNRIRRILLGHKQMGLTM